MSDFAEWTDTLYQFYQSLRVSKFSDKEALYLVGQMVMAATSKTLEAS